MFDWHNNFEETPCLVKLWSERRNYESCSFQAGVNITFFTTKNSWTINIALFDFLYCDTAFVSADADYRVSELCLGSSCISDCTSRNPSAHTSDRNSCFMPLLISRTRIEDDFKEIWCLLFCNSFPKVHIFNNDLLPCWICVHVCFSVSILRLHSWCQYFKQHVSVVFVFSWLSVQFGVTSCGDCLSFLGFSLCVI